MVCRVLGTVKYAGRDTRTPPAGSRGWHAPPEDSPPGPPGSRSEPPFPLPVQAAGLQVGFLMELSFMALCSVPRPEPSSFLLASGVRRKQAPLRPSWQSPSFPALVVRKSLEVFDCAHTLGNATFGLTMVQSGEVLWWGRRKSRNGGSPGLTLE